MLTVLFGLIIFIAAAGIVYWFLQTVPLPQPVAIIVYAVLACVALYLLFMLFGMVSGGTPALTALR